MLKTLISIRLSAAFGALAGVNNRKKRSQASRAGSMIFIYAILGICFLFVSFSIAMALGPILIAASLDWLYFGIFTLIAFSLIFIFSIFETKSELFDCRDNELLLSLPIPSRYIVMSRALTVVIFNYIEAGIILLPAIVVYSIFSGGNILGILGSVLVLLFLPLLATACSSAFGYLIARISVRVKGKTFVVLAISLVLLFAYIFGYTYLIEGMDSFFLTLENDPAGVAENMKFLYGIGSISLLSPLATVLFVLVTILSAALAFYVISRSYIRIVTTNHTAGRVSYTHTQLEKSSAFLALSKKELRRFISSSTYMLNGSMGAVFQILICVFAFIKREELSETLSALGLSMELIVPVMVTLPAAMALMNSISASALSIEGKSLWILKTAPVSTRTVLLAKCVPHILVTGVPTLISSLLLAILCSASPIYWPFFLLIPPLAVLLSAFMGLTFNLLFPKLDFENEVQVLKQSTAVFLSTLPTMLLALVLIGVVSALSIFSLGMLALVALLVIFLLLTALFGYLVFYPLSKKYDAL